MTTTDARKRIAERKRAEAERRARATTTRTEWGEQWSGGIFVLGCMDETTARDACLPTRRLMRREITATEWRPADETGARA